MRSLVCKIWLMILLVVCIGRLPAEGIALPAKQLLFDDAGIFRKSPEKKRELEELLEITATKYHFDCYLFTKKDLQLDHISNVSRQLCSEFVGERSGCVLLYDESTQHLHLSSPLSVAAFEGSHAGDAYIPSVWLEDQFLNINQRIIAGNSQLQTEDYVAGMAKEINLVIQQRLQPEPRRMIVTFLVALCAVLLVGFIASHSVAWRSNKARLRQQQVFNFPKCVMHQRLQAKFGGNIAVRNWAAPPAVLVEKNDFFLTKDEPVPQMRKQITGRAMMFRLLGNLHDQSLTKEEMLDQYEISGHILTKWQHIYEQKNGDSETVGENQEIVSLPKASAESKTLPLMPL